MKRVIYFVIILASTLVGCTTPKEYVPPQKVVLQDPLPGQGLIYLLRAPYDDDDISWSLNGGKVTSLPKERYTAVSVAPGTYSLKTEIKNLSISGSPAAIPVLTFSIRPNERLCFFLPAPERKLVQSTDLLVVPHKYMLALSAQHMKETGAERAWTQATPDDVNWFINYTKP